MSSGREDIQIIIAVDYSGKVECSYIINVPDEYKLMFENEDIYIEDFKNLELVPKELGLYRLDCSFWWVGGRVMFFDQSDPNWGIEIIKVTKLYDCTV